MISLTKTEKIKMKLQIPFARGRLFQRKEAPFSDQYFLIILNYIAA